MIDQLKEAVKNVRYGSNSWVLFKPRRGQTPAWELTQGAVACLISLRSAIFGMSVQGDDVDAMLGRVGEPCYAFVKFGESFIVRLIIEAKQQRTPGTIGIAKLQ